MAHQAAREFETLRDELCCLKETNESLRVALDEAESQRSDESRVIEFCERCNILEKQLDSVTEQKRKALGAARFAAEKLCEFKTEHQCKLDHERQRNLFIMDLLQRKETEIELLKREILHYRN